jgi:hypothetical protein
MVNRRDDEWETDNEAYNESQVEAVIEECGIEIDSETSTHFLCFCPFHGNNNSPALAVDKTKGLYFCFGAACGTSGKLEDLPKRLLKYNIFQTRRLLLKYRNVGNKTLEERLAENKNKVDIVEWEFADRLPRMQSDFWDSEGYAYMRGRGFEDETLKHFGVGYSVNKGQVAVPMYAPEGFCVGVIGLPRRFIPWNFQNARKCGDTVIICESSFDAMKIHQAGYANVIALLGGSLSMWQQDLINRTFSKIIIMTDFDKKRYVPDCKKCKAKKIYLCEGHRDGREFGRLLAEKLPNKKIMWAAYDDTCVYPHEAKDATDMTEEEIRQCLKNAISNFRYALWNIEE